MQPEPQQPLRSLEEMRESANRFAEGKKSVREEVPATEYEKAYANYLQKQNDLEKDISLNGILSEYTKGNKQHKFKPYGITLDDAKKVLWIIIKEELAKRDDVVVLDGNTADVLHNLTMYFIGLEGEYELRKGIYLYGNVGRGKTFILECFQKLTTAIETRFHNAGKVFTARSFKIVQAKEMILEVSRKKSLEVLQKYEKGNLVIDDLGQDKDHGDTQKLWGNETDVVGDVITQRYINFNKMGAITHATSNLTCEEWKRAYGTRVESRMFDMFNIVGLSGEDKRLPVKN